MKLDPRILPEIWYVSVHALLADLYSRHFFEWRNPMVILKGFAYRTLGLASSKDTPRLTKLITNYIDKKFGQPKQFQS